MKTDEKLTAIIAKHLDGRPYEARLHNIIAAIAEEYAARFKDLPDTRKLRDDEIIEWYQNELQIELERHIEEQAAAIDEDLKLHPIPEEVPTMEHEFCFITHHATTSWGYSIYIMENKGEAYARMYWYDDDPKVVYIEGIHVSLDARSEGIGTALMFMMEKITVSMGAATNRLWVKKDTWVHDWYIRLGYTDHEDIEELDRTENAVWMIKLL